MLPSTLLEPDEPVKIPPGMKPEEIARYTLEQMRKRRGAQMDSQVREYLPVQMKTLEDDGQYATMRNVANARIKENPKDLNAPFYLGQGLYWDGDFAGAQKAWQKAQSDPQLAPQIAAQKQRIARIQSHFPI